MEAPLITILSATHRAVNTSAMLGLRTAVAAPDEEHEQTLEEILNG